jgi:hypothetical protein
VTELACENCGIPDDELVAVRRVYLRSEEWDRPASHTVVPEVERWCISCASQYPCEPAGDDD